jgi:hypothetical protein
MVKDAHFTLPFRATWADSVLPPGDYTLPVTKLSGGRDVHYSVTFAGAGTKLTILVVRQLGPRVGEGGMLVAVRSGELHSISALHLPKADLVPTFSVPKAKQALVAKAPEIIQSVPILVVAK